MYLERLAATYWRFLERVSLHLLHMAYGPDSRAVKFLFIPLLTFHAPEYETSRRRRDGDVADQRGLPRGAGRPREGYLRITV